MPGPLKNILKKDQLILLAAGVMAIILMSLLFGARPQFLRILDLKLYDQFMKSNHIGKQSDVPIIIDIDEKSLKEFGQWPWPRYRVAMLLQNLSRLGAASVATDIIFVEPDKTSPLRLQEEWKRDLKINVDFQGLPHGLRDNDQLLADNLRTGPFVLGIDFASTQSGTLTQPGLCDIKPVTVNVYSLPGARPAEDFYPNMDAAICPVPALAAAAPGIGFITINADEDSIYRKAPLLIRWNHDYYPSLALAALMQATGQKEITLKITPIGVDSIRLGNQFVIPTDKDGRILINFRGPSKTFEYVSAADVLGNKLKPNALKGRIAFIGTSASGLKDIRPIPLDQGYPGVEAHATIVDNILSQQFLRKPDWSTGLELSAMIGAILVTTMLLMWASAAWMAVPVIAMAMGIWYGSVYIYAQKLIYLSPLYSFIGLALTFTLLTVIKFWREEHAKRFIHGAFAHYLAPSVISQIMDNPDALSLEGQEKNITIQFSDVRDFTSLSEKLTPSQVTALLHDYLTPMTQIITEHDGTLDKFIGDAVMAFWNAPLDVENHQEKSLYAALAQQQKLKELNTIFLDKYGFTIDVGIGIHSGPVRVGNMGSADLFDYTLIGDNVNIASRLEGLTKYYGQTLVVSQAIVDACKGNLYFRVLDRVRVKGRDEPVTIFTAYTPQVTATRQQELADYDEAYELYLTRQFSAAHTAFGELDKLGTEPKLYALYMQRCEHLGSQPPGEDWDGVFVHETK